MENLEIPTAPCTCGAEGRIHAAGCGCHAAGAFLARPTAAYTASRRDFLRKAISGGMAVATLPLLAAAPAEADIFKPGVADQKKLGNQAAAEVLQKYRVVKDSRAREFRRIGGKLINALSAKERGPWDYEFRVLDSKEINAFAVPGGDMFLFTGLFDRLSSASAVAAVTGHEISHVRREHWARAVAERSKRNLGIEVLLGLTRAGSGWRQIAGLGDTLLTKQYSRGEENQADDDGLKNIVEAGFDPEGMLDLFETLQKAAGGRGEGPEFLRDHPLTGDRIRRTRERIQRLEGR